MALSFQGCKSTGISFCRCFKWKQQSFDWMRMGLGEHLIFQLWCEQPRTITMWMPLYTVQTLTSRPKVLKGTFMGLESGLKVMALNHSGKCLVLRATLQTWLGSSVRPVLQNPTSASISGASSYPVGIPVKCLSNRTKEICLREYLTNFIQKSSDRSIKSAARTVSK